MNAYESYLEDLLIVKEKELTMYKRFIEEKLNCTIRETIEAERGSDRKRNETGHFKIVTIPQSKFIVQID